MTDHAATVKALLETYPTTLAERTGVHPSSGKPDDLFGLLVTSLLVSARIGSELAVEAARALHDDGLTSAQKLHDAGAAHRTAVLNHNGYARYDNQGSHRLGETAKLLLERWHGDLGELRAEAGTDAPRIHELLQEFTGIGPVGADVFCREAQGCWAELHPFVDDAAAKGAAALGLPTSAAGLADLVPAARFPLLVSGLSQVSREGPDEVRATQA